MSSDDRFTYRDIPFAVVAALPWIAILGFGLVAAFPALATRSPSPASFIVIALLVPLGRVFARWARRPTVTFLSVTAAAYLIAIVIVWGRTAGWLALPK